MYDWFVFTECGPGEYHETGFSACKKCPRDTYLDSNENTSCIACPYGGKIEFEGATSREQCHIHLGNFDLNHTSTKPEPE